MSDAQKHILVVSYSQTGQLDALTSHFLHPLKQQENTVIEEYKIRPLQPYTFPWKFIPFFNQFPESVHLKPAPIETPELQQKHYDLVIIAYTVWFCHPLSPSPPFCSQSKPRF